MVIIYSQPKSVWQKNCAYTLIISHYNELQTAAYNIQQFNTAANLKFKSLFNVTSLA